MKKLFFLLTLAILVAGCGDRSGSREATDNYPEPALEVSAENFGTISFDVEGMTCTGCENSVTRSLERLEGVVKAEASHETGKTVVQYDMSRVTAEKMEETIESRGYKVTGHSPEN
jgi:mercuric ion transport protein